MDYLRLPALVDLLTLPAWCPLPSWTDGEEHAGWRVLSNTLRGSSAQNSTHSSSLGSESPDDSPVSSSSDSESPDTSPAPSSPSIETLDTSPVPPEPHISQHDTDANGEPEVDRHGSSPDPDESEVEVGHGGASPDTDDETTGPSTASDGPDPSLITLNPALYLEQCRQELGYTLTQPRRALPSPLNTRRNRRILPRSPLATPPPKPRPPSDILLYPFRSLGPAHTPSESQDLRRQARQLARERRMAGDFEAASEDVLRAGYRPADGHRVSSRAILDGGRTMDWTGERERVVRFGEGEGNPYWRRVEATLMIEAATEGLTAGWAMLWDEDSDETARGSEFSDDVEVPDETGFSDGEGALEGESDERAHEGRRPLLARSPNEVPQRGRGRRKPFLSEL